MAPERAQVDSEEANALQQRYFEVFDQKASPTLEKLVAVSEQVNPSSDLYWYIEGIYGRHYGARRKLGDRVREEAQYGLRMDVEGLNSEFYNAVEQGVQRYTRGKGTDMQRAAIRAYLEKLRNAVTPDDILPERKRR